MLALGVTKIFFECFWQCTPCMLKRPKMQLKKMGWGEFFEDFFKFHLFDISHHYPNVPKSGQGGGNGPV